MEDTKEHGHVEISGTVERVIYRNAENGFSIISLKVSSSETVAAKGLFPEIFQGEVVSLKGAWGFHPKFGRQFDCKEFFSKAPSSVGGIEKYLASGLIKGIGPKFAKKLVDYFGEKTLQIIDEAPNRLQEISGVGPARVNAIIQAWQDQKEISQVMVFLRSKDVSTAYAVKIYKTYGNLAIEKIKENPYRLVEDIWGIGFKSADQIALNLGIEQDSPERIKAGILHSINEATSKGHLYADVPSVRKLVIELLGIDGESSQGLIKQALTGLYNKEKIILISDNDEHFLTLPKFYFSEKNIAHKILTLLNYDKDFASVNIDEAYQFIRTPDDKNIELNEEQQRGIISCLESSFNIITGGPGTGKTTMIRKLLDVLEKYKFRFRLAAPTGRAAKRMFEGTGRNTETLHRLLEFTPNTMSFARNEQNALDLDYLIVDEASMIDVFLMNAIIKALPQNARIVLIGDVDQLPSVGAGNILHDLIDSKKVAVTQLKEIFRQAQDSMIVVNAHRVNKGDMPNSTPTGTKKDFYFIKEEVPENIFPRLHKIYKNKLPSLGIKRDNTVVLVPMNRGTVGVQRINQELQTIINPAGDPKKQVTRFGLAYKPNDRVMQIRNNYDKFVFNGDIGYIREINKEDQKLFVQFGERTLEYDMAELNELVHAYAISIHKSQGSEFDAVIIPIFMQHFILLQRNLIYTAITRAKKLCILIGQTKAVAMGIKNNKGTVRKTFLKEFLTTDLQAR